MLITIGFFKLFRTYANPAFVFALVWTSGLFFHLLFSFTLLPDILPISIPVHLIFTGGSLSFGLGALLAELLSVKLACTSFPGIYKEGSDKISLQLRLFFLFLLAAILPFYVQKAINIVIASEIENFLMGLRWELTYGDADYGWYKYIITLSIIAYAYCLIASIEKPSIVNRTITILTFLITLTYVVLFTGRTFFLMILMIYLFVNFFLNPKFSLKRLIWLIPLALLIFVGIGLVLNKGGSLDDSFSDNLKSASELTGVYLVGGLSAFQYEVSNLLNVGYNGMNSLRFFYLIGEKLGFSIPPDFKESPIQEFVYIPYETNVYTIYSPYIRDFGVLYAFVMLFIYGLIHTYIFIRAKQTKKTRFIIYCSLLMYPIVMAIFSDQYFSILSTWLQIIIMVESIYLLNRFFILKKI
jgi:oligosaccharide repeat unit polymerase